jgi:DNA-directed RNA polymerase subunit RPC12/RpoP
MAELTEPERGRGAERAQRPARAHVCPACGSRAIERVARRGLVERVLAPLAGRWPYRCLDCDRRFHDRRSA